MELISTRSKESSTLERVTSRSLIVRPSGEIFTVIGLAVRERFENTRKKKNIVRETFYRDRSELPSGWNVEERKYYQNRVSKGSTWLSGINFHASRCSPSCSPTAERIRDENGKRKRTRLGRRKWLSTDFGSRNSRPLATRVRARVHASPDEQSRSDRDSSIARDTAYVDAAAAISSCLLGLSLVARKCVRHAGGREIGEPLVPSTALSFSELDERIRIFLRENSNLWDSRINLDESVRSTMDRRSLDGVLDCELKEHVLSIFKVRRKDR